MATPESIQPVDRGTRAPSQACLTSGCPCKDARIVSHRRAAFYAAVARQRGETANRVIPAEPDWTLPAGHDGTVDTLLTAEIAELVGSLPDAAVGRISAPGGRRAL